MGKSPAPLPHDRGKVKLFDRDGALDGIQHILHVSMVILPRNVRESAAQVSDVPLVCVHRALNEFHDVALSHELDANTRHIILLDNSALHLDERSLQDTSHNGKIHAELPQEVNG